MKASIKDFEIMAPVGSRESLAAAIQAGADSIYFGIESLNMRARSASTFTVNDLREIAQICDKHGIKSYLTINTIIYDEDIALMRTIVDAAKEAGISAVIAADVAVMAYCCEVGQEELARSSSATSAIAWPLLIPCAISSWIRSTAFCCCSWVSEGKPANIVNSC